jgi:predicted RNase H-like HicB family nuclease
VKKYIAFFEYDENDGYSVVFPDLPGCFSAGDDYDDTYRMAHDALALHLKGLEAEGYPVPEPRSLEQIKAKWEDWPEWEKNYKFLVVPVAVLPVSEKSVRVNVMLPEATLYRIDAVSKNRSAFLAYAAERMFEDEPWCGAKHKK